MRSAAARRPSSRSTTSSALERRGRRPVDTTIFVVLGAVIGSVTFTGSLIAGGKLQGLIAGKPIMIPGGRIVTVVLAAVAVTGRSC